MSNNQDYKQLARYRCALNCADESAPFEVRSREIIVRARDAIDAQTRAAAVTGRGVVEVIRLDEVA